MLIKKKYFYLIFFILISLTSFELLAATYYWVAPDDGETKYYKHTANWATSSGGDGGVGIDSAPNLDD